MKTAYPELGMLGGGGRNSSSNFDRASAAYLWLADTERLESLIRKSDAKRLWKLTRALALCGAEEAPEDLYTDHNKVEGKEDVLVRQEEEDEENERVQYRKEIS
ncbi:hypothetical protein AtubIFM55763_010978 [Aspergillus tubingensis]|uniref:Uncharacterized protein n=1 Tax=Aspergillus tubingensis TaxID=5068 RepID=A0A9W6AXH4_ASPTU|nr:hypothetical protein AtubIFM54640_009058 [Aspergillus tubingensis]GLA70076.1 hypothetical protein AtubIFM55763_010978 [Aspergillus tubingensis]GLA90181.1 hypothetical protein AtubIFM56815_005744 [Aspergillus tubingensis]GLA98530.1 hypothetical protein AtubIFM57143_006473 [Aspergillus tubingensis]